MAIKYGVKWIALVASVLLLTACGTGHKTSVGADGSRVQTSGLGAQTRFPGAHAGQVNPSTGQKYNTVYFSYDSDGILEQYMSMIRANANYLKSHPSAKVRLEGHTDPRGSREYNVGLGQRRGNSVADALDMMGVSHNQYIVVSYGKEKLAVPGHSEEDYQLDRRVEIIYERG